LESVHNVSQAALNVHANVTEIPIEESRRFLAADANGYGVGGYGANGRTLPDLLAKHNFTTYPRFQWSEAINAVFRGQGCILANFGGHEVAVVGMKFIKNEQGNFRLHFLVADSLKGGNVPPGTDIKPEWVLGEQVVTKIPFERNQGIDYDYFLHLVTWSRK
jgi:hypothetical protein